MYVTFIYAYACACMCADALVGQKKGIEVPGVRGGCELHDGGGWWESNSGPPQEHKIHSSQPPSARASCPGHCLSRLFKN